MVSRQEIITAYSEPVEDNAGSHELLLDQLDRKIIALLQTGLPICSRPYAELAEQLQLTEQQVIQRIQALRETDSIKRFGIIVRHHELGYQANAMVVWDIPDNEVDEAGRCFSQYDFVTLCYQRPRKLPEWPYNLFSMIHGQDKSEVLKRVEEMNVECETSYPYKVLFSRRRFKQRGAVHQVKSDVSLHMNSHYTRSHQLENGHE